MPSIGCAKSKLIGNYEEPGLEKGDYTDLYYKDHILGSVLRSRRNCRPLFVSPGYHCTIGDARKVILQLCSKYRICDPIRRVDALSKMLR
jgi:deoxyribonuclease V